MSRSVPSLLTLAQSFFQDHLRAVRGASDHTVRTYRDALRLFFVLPRSLNGGDAIRLVGEHRDPDGVVGTRAGGHRRLGRVASSKEMA